MEGLEEIKVEDMLKLENQLCFSLYVTSKEIVNVYRPYLEPLDLTYTQYIVMMALWEYKDMAVKELGHLLMLDSGTLTPLLKKLEAKGYLSRKRSKKDERVVMVILTAEGKALRERAMTVPQELTKSVKGFSVEDVRELKRLLRKLQVAMGVLQPEEEK